MNKLSTQACNMYSIDQSFAIVIIYDHAARVGTVGDTPASSQYWSRSHLPFFASMLRRQPSSP